MCPMDGEIMTTGVIRTGNSTGIGTGTTRTEITPAAGLFLPDDAKVLLDVVAVQGIITPTAAQSVSTKLELASSSIKNLTPYNALFPPIGSSLGAFSSNLTGKETWDVDALLNGGEAIHVWATALVANAVAPECQAFLTVSNDLRDAMHPVTKMMRAQKHAEIGTFTATGTTADTDVAGTKYSISGAREIVELFGELHPKTVAAGDMVIGEIKFVSTEFMDSYDQTLPLYPMSLGNNGASVSWLIPGISRKKVRIPIKPNVSQCNIVDNLNFGGALGTAGSFVSGVVYT